MTNQEIEKRFEFDLNMNVFERVRREFGSEVFIFNIYKEEHPTDILNKIVDILTKNGYEKDNLQKSSSIESSKVILIWTRDKIFRCIEKYEFLLNRVSEFNDVPDYIREYDINYD